jgi:hypothetical protein
MVEGRRILINEVREQSAEMRPVPSCQASSLSFQDDFVYPEPATIEEWPSEKSLLKI